MMYLEVDWIGLINLSLSILLVIEVGYLFGFLSGIKKIKK